MTYVVYARWCDNCRWGIIRMFKTKKEAQNYVKKRNERSLYSAMKYKIKKE